MNLRDIKKDIDYVLGAFVEDCSVCAAVNPDLSETKIAGLMEEEILDSCEVIADNKTVIHSVVSEVAPSEGFYLLE